MKTIIILAFLLVSSHASAQQKDLLGVTGTPASHPTLGISYVSMAEATKEFSVGIGIDAGARIIETPSIDAKEVGVQASGIKGLLALQNAFILGAMPILSYRNVFAGIGFGYYRYKIIWYRLDFSNGSVSHSTNDDEIVQDVEPLVRLGYKLDHLAIALSFSNFRRTSLEVYMPL